jgi:hypothetical protein
MRIAGLRGAAARSSSHLSYEPCPDARDYLEIITIFPAQIRRHGDEPERYSFAFDAIVLTEGDKAAPEAGNALAGARRRSRRHL